VERVNLLVTDLDGTLLGDECALDEFAAWYRHTKGRLRLVYSSGRFPESVRHSIEEHGLPEPDAIIGGVGTEIRDLTTGRRLIGWPPVSYRWNPYIVRATCGLHEALLEQPQHFLSQYKVSFYGYDLDDAFLHQLASDLAAAGQDVTIIYSSSRDLDILPAETGKGASVEFLAERWRIHRERVIVAGDSGNDRDMFCRGFRGIIVGNAQLELKSLEHPGVYRASKSYAAGVVEGLEHWLRDESRCARSWF
jgi:mannosylfructose-6-phosphate phosphatase